jgi:hypothetical protein
LQSASPTTRCGSTQSWAIARSSTSLTNLWHNRAYEGHPPLWHLILFGLTRFTTDVRAMQVITWAVAATTAALLLFRSPWHRVVRVALCFGYFIAFEYGVLSRSYSLTLLLASYLDRPIYSAATGRPIRFVRYNEPTLFFMHSPQAAVLRNARTLADASHHGAVVIADRRHHHLLARLPGRWLIPDARLVVPIPGDR